MHGRLVLNSPLLTNTILPLLLLLRLDLMIHTHATISILPINATATAPPIIPRRTFKWNPPPLEDSQLMLGGIVVVCCIGMVVMD